MAHFVYILCCSDDSYYCGYSSDPKKRLVAHNSGSGSKYVRARRPAKLIYFEKLPCKSAALKREHAIKRLSRKKKEILVKKSKSLKPRQRLRQPKKVSGG